jgi:pilin isopeptide linkage protein/LPXTG-motif cell wall-anchored protein
LQQYLTNPVDSLIETTDEYEMPSDGFYLLSFESESLQTVQNDASGLITFNALHFEKDGNYDYIIREKAPENTNNILYDKKELDLSITVSKNDKQLTADITSEMTNFQFTNHTTYRLPDTGGKGVIPYIVVGTAMMGTALMLLHRKRKEA